MSFTAEEVAYLRSQPLARLATNGRDDRIDPTESWSWNMSGEPVGASWYEARHAVHRPGAA